MIPRVAIRSFHFTPKRLEKTPVQVFFDTFRKELKKSKELQSDIKALQDETGRLSESTAFKRAKDALDKSKEARSATSRNLRKASGAVGSAAGATWNSSAIRATRDAMAKTVDAVDKASQPIRDTEAWNAVRDAVDEEGSIRYGGFESKEQRRKRRERELKKLGNQKPVKENEDAGEALVVHETAKPDSSSATPSYLKRKWQDFKLAYEESDNGLVSAVRTVTDGIGRIFGETEQAQVARTFREMDPTFTQDAFLREMRGYILPEVLDAYVRGDGATLKKWFSEASHNVWNQLTKDYRDRGLYSAGRVLDLRNVDILQAKILQPVNIPVYVVSCRAQETNYYKSLKTDEVAAGIPDQILLSTYVMVVTRDPEQLDNEETRGWKILEFVRGRAQEWM